MKLFTNSSRSKKTKPSASALAIKEEWFATPKKVKTTTSKRTKRLKLTEIFWLTEELAVTMDSGRSIETALSRLGSLKEGTSLGRHITTILAHIQKGIAPNKGNIVADAFRKDGNSWDPSMVAIIAAGESTGHLGESFMRIADLVQRRIKLRQKTLSAMAYPVMIAGIIVFIVAGMLLFIVPKFKSIYASIGSELPPMTKLLLSISAKAPLVGLVFVLTIVGIFWAMRYGKRNANVGIPIEKIKFKIPIIGDILKKGVFARTIATLSALSSPGVEMFIIPALAYAAESSGSHIYRASLLRVQKMILNNTTFSQALAIEEIWPESLVQEISIADDTGKLAGPLKKYSDRSFEDMDRAVSRLIVLIEPIMMVAIGVIVGFMLVALYLPMLNLGSKMQ
jgi:type IV pilus assembly protein PilC